MGGKATASAKGKGRASKAPIPTFPPFPLPSTSAPIVTEEFDWDTPTESEDESVVSAAEAASEQYPSTSSDQSRPKRAFGCVPAHPRNEHVTEKLRRKIRQGEFIDLKMMLPRRRDEIPHKKFSIVDGVFEEIEDNATLNFYSWIDAFITFMSVHLEFYPLDIQGMLRHFEIVKGFHAAGSDGVEYDYLFRRLKSRNADIVWGEYIAELARGVKPLRAVPLKKPDPPRNKPQWKTGPCHNFNSASGCNFGSKCRYLHKCKKCASSDHPQFRCSKK